MPRGWRPAIPRAARIARAWPALASTCLEPPLAARIGAHLGLGSTPTEGALVEALAALGATPADVVRTRIYVTDIRCWEEVGRAHGEVFGAIRPASAMVEVSGLVDPAMLVEIDHDGITGHGEASMPPYLGETLDSGIATLLAEESLMALKYLYNEQPEALAGFHLAQAAGVGLA